MASKFPQTIHKVMESLDLEHTLFVHMLFMNHYIDSQKYTFRDDWDVDDFCTCYNDMMQNPIPDNVGDCNRGLEYFLKQWYEDVPSRYKKAIRDLAHRRQEELFKQKDCTMRKMQIIQDLLSDVYSNLHAKVSKQDDIALLNDMDAKLLLFQTRTSLFWEGCSTYEDMFSDDFELDENGGMWQWYLERLKADKKQQVYHHYSVRF